MQMIILWSNTTFTDSFLSLNYAHIAFLNDNSLNTKLLVPEFVQFIQDFDCFVCAETKLSRSDSIEVDGYTFYPSKFNRYSRKSGGVGLFVKDNFVKEIDLFVCADHCK